jgi:hypothetical protein
MQPADGVRPFFAGFVSFTLSSRRNRRAARMAEVDPKRPFAASQVHIRASQFSVDPQFTGVHVSKVRFQDN